MNNSLLCLCVSCWKGNLTVLIRISDAGEAIHLWVCVQIEKKKKKKCSLSDIEACVMTLCISSRQTRYTLWLQAVIKRLEMQGVSFWHSKTVSSSSKLNSKIAQPHPDSSSVLYRVMSIASHLISRQKSLRSNNKSLLYQFVSWIVVKRWKWHTKSPKVGENPTWCWSVSHQIGGGTRHLFTGLSGRSTGQF